MYTAFDFINTYIPIKKMRFGWKLEIEKNNLFIGQPIVSLTYRMLNFDSKSIEWLGWEAMNKFLVSDSYKNFKVRKENAMKKYGRLYYSAYSLSELKEIIAKDGLKVNIDKLIDKIVKQKSIVTKEKIKSRLSNQ